MSISKLVILLSNFVIFSLTCLEISLEKKIGQMILVGFKGTDEKETSAIIENIKNYDIGGVILLGRNVCNPHQLKMLINSLQNNADIPLFIAIDYEGGYVNRLSAEKGFSKTVSAKKMGEQGAEYTYQCAKKMAQHLGALGINMNFAPVVDLHNEGNCIANKERCFSKSFKQVVNCAGAFIKAHEEEGICCTLKHYPGHGSSTTDSHHDFTDVTRTWKEEELIPYTYFIDKGEAKCIMASHVCLRSLDDTFPASMSFNMITKLLRETLGFKGVVITDDIQMDALYKNYSLNEIVINAINAGVDILLINNNNYKYEENIVSKVFSIIKNAVETDRISACTIDEAYSRITSLKRSIIPHFID